MITLTPKQFTQKIVTHYNTSDVTKGKEVQQQHSVCSSDTEDILHAPTELGEQVPIDESDPDGESDDDHRKDGGEHVEEGGGFL